MKLKLVLLVVALAAIFVGMLIFAKIAPGVAVKGLFVGSLGSVDAISGTFREFMPLVIAGLAVYIALRAGMFNIGVEGQLLMGAMVSIIVSLRIHGILGIILATLCGCLAGAIWAYPAAAIKAYRNGHEVITTIMLNAIAVRITDYVAKGPLHDPSGTASTTVSISDSTRIGNVVNTPTINLSLIIGILAVIGFSFWLQRTVRGYELRAVGENAKSALFAGIEPKAIIVRSMLASGAVAGLAGAFMVLATEGRFYADFSPGYGFDALGVALLAGSNPLMLIPSGFLFAALAKGGTSLAIEGVPKGMTTMILGIVIIIAAAIRYRKVAIHE